MASATVHPRAARTREALLAAGFDLLAERPIDAIAIDAVVARAGVAKGSFFNHFADKQAFAEAISAQVRGELEQRVDAANQGVADPVERLAGGMGVCASFAREHPKRAAVMLRGLERATARAHPLNRGLLSDIEAASAAGVVRPAAANTGVLYWLGLCQALILNLIDRPLSDAEADVRFREMLVLGLSGLGVTQARIDQLVSR